MNINQLLTDVRGATPVIGNVTIVAVVVILGATVSVYSLGIADDVTGSAPQASFEYAIDSDGDIVVTKTGGDKLNADQIRFGGAALEKNTFGGITEWAGGNVNAGDSATVNAEAGETLLLVWKDPGKDGTATIMEYEVPGDVGASGSVSITNVQSVKNKVEVSVGTLSQISGGNANLVVESDSGRVEKTVSSGATPTVSLPVGWTDDSTETVDVTLYESGTSGEIASDSGAESEHASIGSVYTYQDTGNPTWKSGRIDIKNIQFNGVSGDKVYIVVDDDPSVGNGDGDAPAGYDDEFSTYGGTLNLNMQDYKIESGETITVTVYESSAKTNVLKVVTAQA